MVPAIGAITAMTIKSWDTSTLQALAAETLSLCLCSNAALKQTARTKKKADSVIRPLIPMLASALPACSEYRTQCLLLECLRSALPSNASQTLRNSMLTAIASRAQDRCVILSKMADQRRPSIFVLLNFQSYC